MPVRQRNFVPEGEDNTTSVNPFGRPANFIPPVDDPDPTIPIPRGEERRERDRRAAKEAEEAANKAVANGRLARWKGAVELLAKLGPAGIVPLIEGKSESERQMFLLAEERYSARPAILTRFPAAGPNTREQWEKVDSTWRATSAVIEPKAKNAPAVAEEGSAPAPKPKARVKQAAPSAQENDHASEHQEAAV
jgi:hypothetical protein